MNKNDEQQFLPAAVQQADTDSVVGLHPQIIVVVGTIEVSLHDESTGGMRKIECISELTNERFEIIALADNNAVGGRSKAGFFRRTIEKLCGGWRVQFFNACDSAADHYKMMIDRAGRILLINADVLRMPYRTLLKLIGGLPRMIEMALRSVKSAVDELRVPRGIKGLSTSKNARISLVASEKGLQFPSGFVLSAEEWMMRVTSIDTELCISAGRRRWIHRPAVALPFYAYKVAVSVEDDAYMVALPQDVLQALGPGSELQFDEYAD